MYTGTFPELCSCMELDNICGSRAGNVPGTSTHMDPPSHLTTPCEPLSPHILRIIPRWPFSGPRLPDTLSTRPSVTRAVWGATSDRLGGSVLQQRQQQASLPRHCSAECGLVAVKSQPVCVVTDNGVCGRCVPVSFSRCFTHNCYEPTGFAVLAVVPSVV